MQIELDKHEFYLNNPKETSHESIKTCTKKAGRHHFCFSLSRAYKVEWDARAMDSPSEKTSTSHLKWTTANFEAVFNFLMQ